MRRIARPNSIPESILWHEPISEGISRTWEIYRTHIQTNTRFQNVLIADTAHGVTLFCNSEQRSSELNHVAYHEGQVMPALLSMPSLPKSALVIGSSEGVNVKMLKEAGVENITHVDFDKECMLLCGKYLPYGYNIDEIQHYSGENVDSLIKIVIKDGEKIIKELRRSPVKYGLIVMAVFDESTGTEMFYNEVRELLTADGALVVPAGKSCLWRCEPLKNSYDIMKRTFHHVTYFEMGEQNWVWLIGHAGEIELSIDQMQENLVACKYIPRFIDALTLSRSVMMPKALRTNP
ncbi:hypothetical protein NVV94_06560 [Pseudomonas sp. LS1212]|uniref:spermine/spermidine synthase domain-containing protein n=1 Tax=Pseudomonas sp. LS1212 TaxID=2972478 RepID=UPI00215C9287|nr:hypothetical protein [Pseudomonas sp. LS1212]UVJ45233.1 hypothetical protein NVV94_06560 [Pseudomonas sp. LS1212]